MLSRLLAASPVTLDALNRAISAPAASPASMASLLLMQDPAAPPEPTLYTVEEVAARLRVSTKSVRRRIKDGTIRTVPIGGRLVRISSNELSRLLSRPAPEP
jgi:excisionase family DNA binding protein